LYDLLQLRAEVLCRTRPVYQDVDGKDQKGMHIPGYERLAAYTEYLKAMTTFDMAT
jgi:ElaA protein